MYRLEQVRQAGRDRGATSTEYALVVAFIALAITAGVIFFGGNVSNFYDQLAAALTAHMPTP